MTERFPDDDSYEKMILSFRQGNQAGLGELYDNYAPALLGVINRILEDPELACDCLQHSFNEIWNQKTFYDPKKERVFTWMIRIARSSALNFRKRQGSFTRKQNTVSPEVCGAVRNNLMNMVDKKAENSPSLPDAESDVLHLVYIKGFTFKEAANRLKVSVQDVKLKFISAIKHLKGKKEYE